MSAESALSTRAVEIKESLAEVRSRVAAASDSALPRTLVAVSKYKPVSDIQLCYEEGQRDFGENYVQELVDKAGQLPHDIRWHFIGTLQSNKAKTLTGIPNLHTVQTLASVKAASALDKSISGEREALNVLIQVNTSGEDSKSGLEPLASPSDVAESEVGILATHIIRSCKNLRFQGLMTIGALEVSLSASKSEENADFETLKTTREYLREYLKDTFGQTEVNWGVDSSGRLSLSMGMSSDFEAALKAGSDIVRVGTGIFGGRSKPV